MIISGNGLTLGAAIGYDNAVSGDLKDFTVDTGSLGAIVPVGDLGPDAIGPGGPGVKFYDSSGNTFTGNYYLAPVSFAVKAGNSTII